MNFLFYFKCFLIGASAASAIGPIFALTFNNGALYGLCRGLITAFAAALGDGFLLFLGLMGALQILETSQNYQLVIDLAGGILLMIFGVSILFSQKKYHENNIKSVDSVIMVVAKTFLSTVINPLTLFFFMFISSQTLGTSIATLNIHELLGASAAASSGSFLVLSIVAYTASLIGHKMNEKNLRLIAIVTSAIMFSIGVYFFIDAFQVVWKIYSVYPKR